MIARLQKIVNTIIVWLKNTFKNTIWPIDRRRILVTLGIYGVLITVICGSSFFAISLPKKGSADSQHHLDYAWQVYKKRLPKFKKGLRAPALPNKAKNIHFAAQHPPLYYALNAPFIGPSLDKGLFGQAVMTARKINIVFALLCTIAFAWGGWILGGKRRALYAISVPSVATSLPLFVRVAGDIMNDILSLLWVTLALILASLIIKRGLQKKYIVGLLAVNILGIATRASFITTLLLTSLSIVIGAALHKKHRSRQYIRGIVIAIAIVLVSLASSSWFYLRNYKMSGSFIRSEANHTIASIQKRTYKTIPMILQSPDFKYGLIGGLYGRPFYGWASLANVPINHIASFVVFVVISSSALIWTIRNRWWQKLNQKDKYVVGLFLIHIISIYMQLILYSRGYGALNSRYLLPIWLPFNIMLVTGLLVWPKLRGLPVVVFTATSWFAIIVSMMWLYAVKLGLSSSSPWQALLSGIERNGISLAYVPLLCFGLVVGMSLQAVALWQLTSHSNQYVVGNNRIRAH